MHWDNSLLVAAQSSCPVVALRPRQDFEVVVLPSRCRRAAHALVENQTEWGGRQSVAVAAWHKDLSTLLPSGNPRFIANNPHLVIVRASGESSSGVIAQKGVLGEVPQRINFKELRQRFCGEATQLNGFVLHLFLITKALAFTDSTVSPQSVCGTVVVVVAFCGILSLS